MLYEKESCRRGPNSRGTPSISTDDGENLCITYITNGACYLAHRRSAPRTAVGFYLFVAHRVKAVYGMRAGLMRIN